MFVGDCRKGMIVLLYPFDLFKCLLIILFNCNSTQYANIVGFIKTKIKINSKSMQIVLISENSQGIVILLIIIFYFKFYKIHLNKLLKTIVLNIYRLVLIDLLYNILIEQFVVSFLNIKTGSKENLEIMNFWII